MDQPQEALAEQLRLANEKIVELEHRLGQEETLFRQAVDQSPLGFWQCQASGLKAALSALWRGSEEGLRQRLRQEPATLDGLLATCRLTHVNETGLRLFQSPSKKDFARNFTQLLSVNSREALIESLAAMAAGRANMLLETSVHDRLGQKRYISLFWTVPAAHANDWSRLMITVVDQTVRNVAEIALRESERRYRALFHESPNVMWLVDPADGAIIDVNQAACDFYGYRRQELLTMRVGQINVMDDPNLNAAMGDAVLGGQKRFEFRHRLANGQLRDVEVYAGPITLNHRRLIYSTIYDITAKKQALESLKKAENDYRGIYENSQAGIMRSSPDGRLLAANPAMARIFGYPDAQTMVAEVVDTARQLHANPAQRPLLLERLERDGQVRDYLLRARRRDGSMVWCSVNLRAVRDDDGRLKAIEGFVEDVSESVEAKEALARSEALYRAIVDNSLSAIYIFQDDVMVFVNRAFCQMLGAADPGAALGQPFWKYIHPADRQWVANRARRRADGEQMPPHYGFRCVRLDGSVIWVDMQATRIEYQGRPAVLGNLIDITESKLLNEKLAQAQKMEAVGTLASGIAHDFNNILQTIGSYVQVGAEKCVPGPDNGDWLGQIDRAVARAADLINRLLAFSRNIQPQLRPVNLNDEVTQTLRLLERTLPKMIRLEANLDPDLPLINGDAIQLEQVIVNLAANARDAMPDGGRLKIKTAAVELGKEFCATRPGLRPGPHAVLSVRDSGPGMDQAILEQAFDPFFSTKEIGQGVGLGLSQVYGTIKNHHGHIECESALGQGARFNIYLPALIDAPLEAAPAPPPALEPSAGHNETVLLVDDEKAILEVGRHILGENGYAVLCAESGERALELLAANPHVALVVLDLGMPGMGGRKCLEEIKKGRPDQRVIVASGYSDDGNRQQALAAGAAAFLPKPYRLPELLRLARQVLDG